MREIYKLIKKLLSKLLLSWSPNTTARFLIILGILLTYVVFILICTVQTTIVDRDHYQKLVGNLRRDSVSIPQMRGMIFSETGDMIAASLPQYDVYFDFRKVDEPYIKTVTDTVNGVAKTKRVRVPLLPKDTIDYYFAPNGPAARYMEKIGKKKAAEYAQAVRNAYAKRQGRFLALRGISYLEKKELFASAPFFSKNKNHIGCFAEERPHRYRPYGEFRLGSSTIGGVFPTDTFRTINGKRINMKGHGRNGLEARFDSLLSGQPGIGFIQRMRNRRETIVSIEPIDGADVYTTLDMEMQTLLDYELNKQIVKLGAVGGWAAVMETKTGKIKAISNLKRFGDHCSEDYNHFVQDLYDPGSTFKTVSYMVLLDDGKITPDTWVDTGNTHDHPSSWFYQGKEIRDDHPVGNVTAQVAMEQSSNIALAKLTTQAYARNPQRYLDLVYNTKIFDDLNLKEEFQGAQRARKRKADEKRWTPMSLAQISYGYETQIPGMYILNFYNAIANDGKLMRPYIVDRVVKDGEVLLRHEPEVINSSICKKSTLQSVRRALEAVVEQGTARTEWNSNGIIIRQGAKSNKLKIAGKTGTAQRYANGNYNYNNGHYVSFAGYFPAEAPQYTCVVVIETRPNGNGRPGGGYMAGPVFRNFAEQIYARSCTRTLSEIKSDSANIAQESKYPKAKRGPERATADAISELGLAKHYDQLNVQNVALSNVMQGRVPNVIGMGAIDATFMLESVGLNVTIIGRGKVIGQSIDAGSSCVKGQTIAITLK